MSGVDVSELAGEDLPQADFPVDSQAEFRLQMAPAVRAGIEQHAKADTSVEICGVLVGRWARDAAGPFAEVTDYIRCDNAASKFAEVTFTHESWAQINAEMDAKYEDKRIVGWYHSHPDFGIFLSDRDCFIHENFFSGPGQVALVVDPVRDLEGIFAWENGKPTPMPHYWVGNEVRTVVASQRNPAAEQARQDQLGGVANAVAAEPTDSILTSPAFLLLTGLSLLVLGYLYGSWKTNWEQQRIIEGTIAHYGQAKFMRYGLQDNLQQVRSMLRKVSEAQAQLPESTEGLTEEELAQYRELRGEINSKLSLCSQALESLGLHFGLSPSEQRVIERLERAALAGQLISPDNRKRTEEPRKPSEPKSRTPQNTLPTVPKEPVEPGPAPLVDPQPAEEQPADVLEPARKANDDLSTAEAIEETQPKDSEALPVDEN